MSMREISMVNMATGRTWRMMGACLEAACKGQRVMFLCASALAVDHNVRTLQTIADKLRITIVNEGIKHGGTTIQCGNGSILFKASEPVDWEKMELAGDNKFRRLFVDHATIESRFEKMLDHLHRFDLPLERACRPSPNPHLEPEYRKRLDEF